MEIHVVQRGETLFSIAQMYDVSAARLAADNGLSPPYALTPGEALVVLRPLQVHTVSAGESLSSIAQAYGVPLLQLLRNNPILAENPAQIVPGEVVVIRYPAPTMGPLYVNGYAYPGIPQPLLRRSLPFLSYLSLFAFGVDPEGRLIAPNSEAAVATARQYGVKPLMLLAAMDEDGQFNNQLASVFLNNMQARRALTETIAREIQQRGYAGVDLDFEYLLPEDAERYVQFIHELSSTLNPLGYVVFTAMAPKTSSDQKGILYEGHDYAGIGWASNAALLMTYEWGFAYGPPMAVSPMPDVRRVLDFAVTQISAQKLFLGIPNYGYDWPLPYEQGVTRARSLSNVEAVALAVRTGSAISYDETAQAPWFTYIDPQGQRHEVWFEDARSIRAKLMLPKEYGLKGVSYWNLMREFPQNWAVLNALYRVGPDLWQGLA